MSEDIFIIDVEEHKKIKTENTAQGSGLICPKRNYIIKEHCGVCDYIQKEVYAKNYHKDHPARVWSSRKKAKSNAFLNVVLPSDPNKSYILEIGANAASQIIDGMEQQGWTDIAHPHAGKGRMMMVTKSKGEGGFNKYSVSPELKNADWDVPEEIWKNVPNLDNIIDMLKEGELTEDNHIRVSSIKMNETFKFRICPPWNHGEVGKPQRVLAIVWRHWGVTPEQISGEETMNWREQVDEKVTTEDTEKVLAKPEQPTVSAGSAKQPGCFGNPKFYNPKDEECYEKCDWFKPCGKVVAEIEEDDIPF